MWNASVNAPPSPFPPSHPRAQTFNPFTFLCTGKSRLPEKKQHYLLSPSPPSSPSPPAILRQNFSAPSASPPWLIYSYPPRSPSRIMEQCALRLEIRMEGSSRPAAVPCLPFPQCTCPLRPLIFAARSPPVASKHDTV